MARPTVPQAPSGLTGLTSCCRATTKGMEDGIGCRKCYRLVQTVGVVGKIGELFDLVLAAWLKNDSANEGITWEHVALMEVSFGLHNRPPVEPVIYAVTIPADGTS